MELPLFLIGYGSIGEKKKLTYPALGRKMDKMLFEHTRLFFFFPSSSSSFLLSSSSFFFFFHSLIKYTQVCTSSKKVGENDLSKIMQTIADPILHEVSLYQKLQLDLSLMPFLPKRSQPTFQNLKQKKAEKFAIILVSMCTHGVDVMFHFYFCTKFNNFKSRFPLPAL